MSQNEKDGDKNFLARWSQRKQEAKLADADNANLRPAEEAEVSAAAPLESGDEQFDLSSLPKLEDVTETTDITGFLRKGVPESLRNAALRKSWALDPAIRDYVNPALDYAYDWNTPGGVPGNGEITAGTDIAKMVLQIMGRDVAGDSAPAGLQESVVPPHGDVTDNISGSSGIDAPQNPPPDLPLQQVRLSLPTTVSTPVLADYEHSGNAQVENTQSEGANKSSAPQQEVRRHGTAKPRV
jgi:hypothetical protein